MIHNQISRHLALGLFSFCFSAAAFAACESADMSKCIGSSKTVDVTFTATLENPSCNVSLGGESNQGGKSMTVDFGQIIATDLGISAQGESRYVRPLGLFLTGCDNMLHKALVTFSAPVLPGLEDRIIDETSGVDIGIKDRVSASFVTFNKERDITLKSSSEGYVVMYDIYLFRHYKSLNQLSPGYFDKSFQVIVRYN